MKEGKRVPLWMFAGLVYLDVDRSKGKCNCVLVCRNGCTSRWESCYRAGMMIREKFGRIV
jgi:hypothetical protein